MSDRPRERLLSPLMLGVASGSILVPLNSTMLAVALPGVMAEFGLGAGDVASLVSLYLGAVAVALPVSGSLGDRFGHRRLFLGGVTGFALASLLAVVAPSFGVLQLARVLQAVSGAFVSTTSAALIRQAAPASRRGEAFGIFDLLVSSSAAAGPFIGGVLVDAFEWRSLFILAIPIAALAALAVGLLLHPGRTGAEERHRPRPLDLPGLAILAALIVAILLAIRPGDPTVTLVAALAIVPLTILLVRLELATDHPAVDPRLFRQRPFAAAVAGVFGATVVLHGCFLIVPLLVEELLHQPPTLGGIALLGISGMGAIVAPLGGRTSDRRGRRLPVLVGSLVMAVGLAGLATGPGTASVLAVALLLAVVGTGMGLAGSPRQAAAFETIEPARAGMAAGTYYTGRYLGGVVGASLAGATLAAGVTPGGVQLGFAILTVAAVGVAVAALGLPSAPRPAGATATDPAAPLEPDVSG